MYEFDRINKSDKINMENWNEKSINKIKWNGWIRIK